MIPEEQSPEKRIPEHTTHTNHPHTSYSDECSESNSNSCRTTEQIMQPSEHTIDSDEFYGEYHGHLVRHLETVLPPLRQSSDALIWTAGDSSLGKCTFVSDVMLSSRLSYVVLQGTPGNGDRMLIEISTMAL